jgi:hypothetical protein
MDIKSQRSIYHTNAELDTESLCKLQMRINSLATATANSNWSNVLHRGCRGIGRKDGKQDQGHPSRIRTWSFVKRLNDT